MQVWLRDFAVFVLPFCSLFCRGCFCARLIRSFSPHLTPYVRPHVSRDRPQPRWSIFQFCDNFPGPVVWDLLSTMGIHVPPWLFSGPWPSIMLHLTHPHSWTPTMSIQKHPWPPYECISFLRILRCCNRWPIVCLRTRLMCLVECVAVVP